MRTPRWRVPSAVFTALTVAMTGLVALGGAARAETGPGATGAEMPIYFDGGPDTHTAVYTRGTPSSLAVTTQPQYYPIGRISPSAVWTTSSVTRYDEENRETNRAIRMRATATGAYTDLTNPVFPGETDVSPEWWVDDSIVFLRRYGTDPVTAGAVFAMRRDGVGGERKLFDVGREIEIATNPATGDIAYHSFGGAWLQRKYTPGTGFGAPAEIPALSGANAIKFSPDGTKVAFQKDKRNVFLAAADGTDARELIREVDLEEKEFAWSPHSDRIVVALRNYMLGVFDLTGRPDAVAQQAPGGIRELQWPTRGTPVGPPVDLPPPAPVLTPPTAFVAEEPTVVTMVPGLRVFARSAADHSLWSHQAGLPWQQVSGPVLDYAVNRTGDGRLVVVVIREADNSPWAMTEGNLQGYWTAWTKLGGPALDVHLTPTDGPDFRKQGVLLVARHPATHAIYSLGLTSNGAGGFAWGTWEEFGGPAQEISTTGNEEEDKGAVVTRDPATGSVFARWSDDHYGFTPWRQIGGPATRVRVSSAGGQPVFTAQSPVDQSLFMMTPVVVYPETDVDGWIRVGDSSGDFTTAESTTDYRYPSVAVFALYPTGTNLFGSVVPRPDSPGAGRRPWVALSSTTGVPPGFIGHELVTVTPNGRMYVAACSDTLSCGAPVAQN
ncbi:hypothetical protein [Streptomyces sp. SID3343]|uniref:hypothetical protein n=1 Tax=Streptomyces sp. SID3343 TaxID=2690260 RepID=UPI0013BEFFF5|nr:hypothetical protein [Streptomyces sp. SID3343]MYW03120.1 hypothetical protein [Streptomyces sp. SID3343]